MSTQRPLTLRAPATGVTPSAGGSQLHLTNNSEETEQYRGQFEKLLEQGGRTAEGSILVDEFVDLFARGELTMLHHELQQLVVEMDSDGNGAIDFEEYCIVMVRLKTTLESPTAASKLKDAKEEADGIKFRQKLFYTLDRYNYSRLSRAWAITLLTAVLVSSAAFILETLTRGEYAQFFDSVELMFVIVCTLELALRLYATPVRWRLTMDFMFWVDILSVVPFYLELADVKSGPLRMIRILRVVRVFKITKYTSWTQLLSGAIKMSFVPLLIAVFLTLVGILFFGSLVYFLERGEWNDMHRLYFTNAVTVSKVQSIIDGIWFALVTMTTVGYGDIEMLTTSGKIVASVTAVWGVVLIAVPISIISINFNYLWTIKQRRSALRAEARQWSDPNKNKAGGEHMPSIDAIQSALKQSQGEGTDTHATDSVVKDLFAETIAKNRRDTWAKVRALEEEYRARIIVALVERWRVWFDLKDEQNITAMLQKFVKQHALGDDADVYYAAFTKFTQELAESQDLDPQGSDVAPNSRSRAYDKGEGTGDVTPIRQRGEGLEPLGTLRQSPNAVVRRHKPVLRRTSVGATECGGAPRSSTSSASSTGGSVSTDGELASAGGGGGGGGGGRRGSTGARPANGDRTSSTKRIHRSRIEHASVGDAPPQGAGGLAMSLPSTFLPGLLKPYLASRGSEGTGLQAIGTTASMGSHSNPLPQILGKGSNPNTGKVHPM